MATYDHTGPEEKQEKIHSSRCTASPHPSGGANSPSLMPRTVPSQTPVEMNDFREICSPQGHLAQVHEREEPDSTGELTRGQARKGEPLISTDSPAA